MRLESHPQSSFSEGVVAPNTQFPLFSGIKPLTEGNVNGTNGHSVIAGANRWQIPLDIKSFTKSCFPEYRVDIEPNLLRSLTPDTKAQLGELLTHPGVYPAFRFAEFAHRGGMRKAESKPYATHLVEVAAIVAPHDKDAVIEALLHDIYEETPFGYQDVADRFGNKVAKNVAVLSEQDKSLPWVQRKEIMRKRIPFMEEKALLVATADKIHNMRSMLSQWELEGERMFKFDSKTGKYGQFKAGITDQYISFRETRRLLSAKENPLNHDYNLAFLRLKKKWMKNPQIAELIAEEATEARNKNEAEYLMTRDSIVFLNTSRGEILNYETEEGMPIPFLQ